MTNETEGPWECEGRYVFKRENRWMASVQPCGLAVETADLEAVARIMAAAPKMKEALELALSCFVGMGFGKCEAAHKARAALAACEPKGGE